MKAQDKTRKRGALGVRGGEEGGLLRRLAGGWVGGAADKESKGTLVTQE